MGDGHVYFASNHELEYSNNPDDKVTIGARFANDGNHYYGNHNYTAEIVVSHPVSTIDLTLLAHAGLTDIAASSGVNVQYMTASRDIQSTALRAEIHKLKDSIKMEVQLDPPLTQNLFSRICIVVEIKLWSIVYLFSLTFNWNFWINKSTIYYSCRINITGFKCM